MHACSDAVILVHTVLRCWQRPALTMRAALKSVSGRACCMAAGALAANCEKLLGRQGRRLAGHPSVCDVSLPLSGSRWQPHSTLLACASVLYGVQGRGCCRGINAAVKYRCLRLVSGCASAMRRLPNGLGCMPHHERLPGVSLSMACMVGVPVYGECSPALNICAL